MYLGTELLGYVVVPFWVFWEISLIFLGGWMKLHSHQQCSSVGQFSFFFFLFLFNWILQYFCNELVYKLLNLLAQICSWYFFLMSIESEFPLPCMFSFLIWKICLFSFGFSLLLFLLLSLPFIFLAKAVSDLLMFWDNFFFSFSFSHYFLIVFCLWLNFSLIFLFNFSL